MYFVLGNFHLSVQLKVEHCPRSTLSRDSIFPLRRTQLVHVVLTIFTCDACIIILNRILLISVCVTRLIGRDVNKINLSHKRPLRPTPIYGERLIVTGAYFLCIHLRWKLKSINKSHKNCTQSTYFDCNLSRRH